MQRDSKGILRCGADFAAIVFGAGIYSVGVRCFTAPNDIAPGGVTGIATLINHVTGLQIGTLIAVINIPLVIAGFFLLNKLTALKTLVGVGALFLLTDYLPESIPVYVAGSGGGILAAVFGGLLTGAGIGTVYSREGTIGGTDIVGKIVNRFFPEIRLGRISLAVNACVALGGWFVYRSLDAVLYALVSVFVQSRVIDSIVYGGLEGKLVMIFSEAPREIADTLLKQKRGVTLINGEGAYSGEQRQVVCLAVRKNDYVRVKRTVKMIDPNAFVIITGASEILGKGFGWSE